VEQREADAQRGARDAAECRAVRKEVMREEEEKRGVRRDATVKQTVARWRKMRDGSVPCRSARPQPAHSMPD